MRLCCEAIVVLLLPLVCMFGSHGWNDTILSGGKPKVRCIDAERRALLLIKMHLHQFSNGTDPLSSWGNEDQKRECCKWLGIRCAYKSGHVITLALSPSTFPFFRGSIIMKANFSFSLVLELRYLEHLDLSLIDFNGSRIPSSIGSLTKLKYLNLSSTVMTGDIPPQLGNLSRLQVLDLSYNRLKSFPSLSVKNLEWLSQLSSLRILDLSGINMSKAHDWLQIINKLPYLTDLKLSRCDLPYDHIIPPSLSQYLNSSTFLSKLYLSKNRISNSIYQWVFNFSHSLVYLDLSFNLLRGSIPEAIGNMTALTYLGLRGNFLTGKIPNSIWNLCTLRTLYASSNNLTGQLPNLTQSLSRCSQSYSLEKLDLSSNQFVGSLSSHTLIPSFKELRLSSNQLNGAVPESIGQLTKLEILDLSRNSWKGVLTEAHFSKLSKLEYLDLSFTHDLSVNTSSDWIPPFQLKNILFGSCNLGPQFPKWFQTQKEFLELDISNSGISDSIPDWLWHLPPKLKTLNLSNNQITGPIKVSSFEFISYSEIDLSSNQIEGSVPLFLFKMSTLNISNNRFSQISSICDIFDDVHLSLLDISYNQLFGKLPDCWSHLKELNVLILANNKLSGRIPMSIGSLTWINTLHVGYNNLTGELPPSLIDCSELVVLDVGENKLSGPISTWIINKPNLVVLSLRSNHFNGRVPLRLCNLQNLQLLDLSSNNFSGSVPNCLGNFTAMKNTNSSSIQMNVEHLYLRYADSSTSVQIAFYYDEILLVWKGKLSKYKNTLGLVISIDLSNNKLVGEIPREITELVGLVSLNLSRNNLSGEIPAEIGQLKSIDALDLSRNQLFGRIPSSLAQIDRLGALDLSNNNLFGKIPVSTQLQSFPITAYMGNPELCGDPLPNKCIQQTTSRATDDQESTDKILTQGYYISLGLGFAVSFSAVCGTLLFNNSFRYSYFKLLNDVGDWLFVTIAIQKAKLLRLIKS